jgi:hypothetical protein
MTKADSQPAPDGFVAQHAQLRARRSPDAHAVEAQRRAAPRRAASGRHDAAVSRALSILPPPSPVFDSYWHFASLRQQIYWARLSQLAPPWTEDKILLDFRFTNPYRAADRVSQYLISHVLQDQEWDERDLTFRTLLFKIFNRIETWELLRARVGEPTAATFDPARYASVLDAAMAAGERIYSGAYIIPPVPGRAGPRKHHSHLRLLQDTLNTGLPARLASASSLKAVFLALRELPGLGPFLAYQFAIDLNYSALLDHSEMEFVQPGPGALDGIRKCFPTSRPEDAADIIRLVCENQQQELAARGLRFISLWGRPLQLIDCQNLFCEISKYARVAHPTVSGANTRTRIKQRYTHAGALPRPVFPTKWGLRTLSRGGALLSPPVWGTATAVGPAGR